MQNILKYFLNDVAKMHIHVLYFSQQETCERVAMSVPMFIDPAMKRLFNEDLSTKRESTQENASHTNLLDIMDQFSDVVKTGLSCIRGLEKSIKHAATINLPLTEKTASSVAWQLFRATPEKGPAQGTAPKTTM